MVARQCRSCPDRKKGCAHGCVELAVSRIMGILSEPERKAARQLREDQFAMQQVLHMRKMRKDRQRR